MVLIFIHFYLHWNFGYFRNFDFILLPPNFQNLQRANLLDNYVSKISLCPSNIRDRFGDLNRVFIPVFDLDNFSQQIYAILFFQRRL